MPGGALHQRLDHDRRDLVGPSRSATLSSAAASPAGTRCASNSSGRYIEWNRSIPPTDTEPTVSPW